MIKKIKNWLLKKLNAISYEEHNEMIMRIRKSVNVTVVPIRCHFELDNDDITRMQLDNLNFKVLCRRRMSDELENRIYVHTFKADGKIIVDGRINVLANETTDLLECDRRF